MRNFLIATAMLAVAGCSSCNEPNQPNQPNAVSASPDCAPPAVMAAGPNCGAMPIEALPGQVWCCVQVQPPAAPPQKVCVTPETCKEIAIPAVYETYCETLQSAPARTEWVKVECDETKRATGQSDCYKLVEIPAVMETVSKQRLVSPASVRYEPVPAVYADVQSAPPPAFWVWKRYESCETAPANAFVIPDVKATPTK